MKITLIGISFLLWGGFTIADENSSDTLNVTNYPQELILSSQFVKLSQSRSKSNGSKQVQNFNLRHSTPEEIASVLEQGMKSYAPRVSNARKKRKVAINSLKMTNPKKVLAQSSDKNSIKHLRYRQHYRDIPIYGNHVIFHGKGASWKATGNFVQGLETAVANVIPSFNSEQALIQAKTKFNGQHALNKPVYTEEKSQLVIYIESAKAYLAYAVSFLVEDASGVFHPHFIIDAKTKEILSYANELQTARVGTGPGGNVKTGRYQYGVDYDKLDVQVSDNRCTLENANVKTIDLNHGTSGTAPHSYTCYENNHQEINHAFSPLNDAHYFGNVVYDMFNDWYATAPLSFQLQMRVHYDNNYENAFWNGSSVTFGDGADRFYPLVSLDVTAHEISHGFTEQNSGLIYRNQSGGINEAFSDMAGEAAEFYLHGSNDFLVGFDIFKAPAAALRYMADPTLDGVSIGHVNDYNAGMDVHYSSGVYNRAFYLLSQTSGWNTRKAFDVFVRANQNYWTPNTDFIEGACGVIDATTDLGYSVGDVESAFSQVGVECALPPAINISPAEISLSVTKGNSASSNITISNSGEADLLWHELAQEYQQVAYDYNWLDIAETGTEITLGDDANQQIPLPFTFKFYDVDYSAVNIHSNGYLAFDSSGSGGSVFENQEIPNGSAPNNFIAPFWDDLNPASGGTVHHYHDADNNRFIVQYTDIPRFEETLGMTFQVILSTDGSMVFQYKEMTGTTTSATVGIENADGSEGLQLAFNNDYVQDETAVQIQPAQNNWLALSPTSGEVAGGSSQAIAANINSSQLDVGNYSRQVVISSNDPVNSSRTVNISLEVTSDEEPPQEDNSLIFFPVQTPDGEWIMIGL